MSNIYLDYASTTPVDPLVLEAMRPYFCEQFGNASSSHAFGREARKALEEARETVARFIGAQHEEMIFNSGGTEGNNHAVFGVARSLCDRGKHIVISSLEHHSVEEPAAYLEREGCRVTSLGVSAEGLVDPQEVKDSITDQTVLVAVMHANNEIGTIQPLEEIGKIAREKNIPFLVDAVQTVGHITVKADALGADLLSLSSHKLYGPKGVGALYVRKGVKLPSFLLGGDQERGRRASTENIAGVVGLAKAVALCDQNIASEIKTQSRMRDKLLDEIPKRIDGVKINGSHTQRLPNNAHFSFAKVDGESLLMSLDMAGIAASMGSACASGAMEPSRVLRAIGLSDDWAYGALRITMGRWTTEEQVDYLLEQLPFMIKSLRI
ncbi:MAG: cysteine desulfurase NifS [Omnitrophica WOR_2 bacterium RIFCSPLOWO2_12_FULL_50_9]|nr:MAG: cysteine desulfurase NifS [Omnitrophica WOR_2 bacterium RIFCSPLOWO2_12_FULL_50_9]